MRAFSTLVALTVLFTGCSVPVVSQVPVPEVQPLPAGSSMTVRLSRVIIDVPKGTIIGERRQGPECQGPKPLTWDTNAIVYNEGAYHAAFDKLLSQYNFRPRKSDLSLFDPPPPEGEVLVGARITNIQQSDCMSRGFGSLRDPEYKGSVRFSVHWEVYSPKEQKVVLALDNQGSGVLNEFRSDPEDSYFTRAFAVALRGLLKNEEFRKLVTASAVKK